MNCEEFESLGLDADRDPSLTPEQRLRAAEHPCTCPRCAALQDSWFEARTELRAFAAHTQATKAPARVEMRLRQEFRTRHHSLKARRVAAAVAWALAGAALLIGAISWFNWLRTITPPPHAVSQNNAVPATQPQNQYETLLASNTNDFTPLPGALTGEAEDTSIVRVRMPRSALASLGLPVNEERASEWIQVDLLVTDDGQPQAVRLPQ